MWKFFHTTRSPQEILNHRVVEHQTYRLSLRDKSHCDKPLRMKALLPCKLLLGLSNWNISAANKFTSMRAASHWTWFAVLAALSRKARLWLHDVPQRGKVLPVLRHSRFCFLLARPEVSACCPSYTYLAQRQRWIYTYINILYLQFLLSETVPCRGRGLSHNANVSTKSDVRS